MTENAMRLASSCLFLRLCRQAPVALFLAIACGAHGESPRHLFLDPAFLSESQNVTARVNPAQRREIVIRADQPWEKLMISFFLTVLDDQGKLRMWYICRDAANQPNVAYAESSDGVTWVKPQLGLVNYNGSTDNNLVGIADVEGTVFRDPKAKPGAEYVYLTRVKKGGMVRYFSPEGLRWERDARTFANIPSDTQNVAFWDESLDCYVLYLRGRATTPGSKDIWRVVTRTTTSDLGQPLGSKVEPAVVLQADGNDPSATDVYNLSAQPYPLDRRWYLGFPSFLQRHPNAAKKGTPNYGKHLGRVEVQFAGSRDGIHWQRYDRQPYARPGLAGTESANMVFMGTGMVVRGDEIWQYGTGFESRHGDVEARQGMTDGVIYRYVQRVDGFVSLEFAAEGGRAVTGPVRIEGPRLALNLDTAALGHLRVGLLDAEGKAIAGFSADDCTLLRANATRALVSWKGAKDLAELQGRDVRLLIAGERAHLYSFYFTSGSP